MYVSLATQFSLHDFFPILCWFSVNCILTFILLQTTDFGVRRAEMSEKGPSCLYEHWQSSSDCTFIQSDQVLHCTLTESLGTVDYHDTSKCWDWQARANSVDPDQMLQNAASDLGLHCLPFPAVCYTSTGSKMDLLKFWNNYGKVLICSDFWGYIMVYQ